ncbi:MAG: periplasmic-type flagellar collar protein FlbB [Rectinemataceae bacterium]
MAGIGKPRVLGRVALLLILIIALVAGGLVWFDWLGLVNAKSVLGPAYRLVGIQARKGSTIPVTSPTLLDEERFAKRLESLTIRSEELDKRESELVKAESGSGQKVQELEDRVRALDDREKSFNETVKQYDDRKANVAQNAVYLTGMPPAKAVEILKALDDQSVIDLFRAVESQAKAAGTPSIVPYWLSLMPPIRSADIQRKMTIKPSAFP